MPRKCKSCGDSFTPTYTSLQSTCGKTECAIAHGRKLQEKQRKANHRQLKKVFRETDRPWHVKTLQTVFNKFIRVRDKDKPCISCDRFNPPSTRAGQWHAGHYLTVGAHPELRYDEDNCHKECLSCNNFNTEHLAGYRINLIAKIGLDKVEWLEGPHEPKKYTIPELQDLIKHYRKKNKEMLN